MTNTSLLNWIPVLAVMLANFALPVCWHDFSCVATSQANRPQSGSSTAQSPAKGSSALPECRIGGKEELTIECNYSAMPRPQSHDKVEPHIALNRAVFSFKTNNESNMHIELTFTNQSTTRISVERTVYLAIDDDNGQNHLRRPLPHVDYRRLEPNQPLTFSETLLAPAFSKGHYWIHMWIPSPNPLLKLDAAHNLLLSSVGVPDAATGLNKLAEFNATAAPNRRHD